MSQYLPDVTAVMVFLLRLDLLMGKYGRGLEQWHASSLERVVARRLLPVPVALFCFLYVTGVMTGCSGTESGRLVIL